MEARFKFGKNWLSFAQSVGEPQIARAVDALRTMLRTDSLAGQTFLDVGCGSGLSSLAALRLGASVQAFDYDADSVRCSELLRDRFASSTSAWKIGQGSALDGAFLNSLGTYDVVYSWGVLHHTGAMHDAFKNVIPLVKPGGKLFIAIYNDQGLISRAWTVVKRWYTQGGALTRGALLAMVGAWDELVRLIKRLARFQNPLPFRTWREYQQERGMSVWHDLVDWVGGYPFEVATPEHIFEYFYTRGFDLINLRTQRGNHGCNEFVFARRK